MPKPDDKPVPPGQQPGHGKPPPETEQPPVTGKPVPPGESSTPPAPERPERPHVPIGGGPIAGGTPPPGGGVEPPPIDPAPVEPPVEVKPPEPAPAGAIRLSFHVGATTAIMVEGEGVRLQDYVDPAGRFVMTVERWETDEDVPVSVDIRRIPGWSCVIVHFGLPLGDGGSIGPYTLEIEDGDHEQVHSFEIATQWPHSMWRWQSAAWPLPMVPVEDLFAAKLLPRMAAERAQGTAAHHGPLTYAPMGLAGIFPDQGAGGGRADIGLVTDWQAEYLCDPSPTALANLLAQGEAGGSIPWNMRDPDTGAPADATHTAWDYASFYPGEGDPQLVAGGNPLGIRIDTAHEPAVAYVPFLLTGDPYFLEILQGQVMMTCFLSPKGWAGGVNPGWPLGAGQTRGLAWATRDVLQAWAVTPDGAPDWLIPRGSFVPMVEMQIAGLENFMADDGALRTVQHAVAGSRGDYDNPSPVGGDPFPAGCWYATWQEDFVAWVVGWGCLLDPRLLPFAQWHAVGLIDRLNINGDNGWCGGVPELYYLGFQPVESGPQYATWAEAWAANAAHHGWTECQTLTQCLSHATSYDYCNGLQAGLAAYVQAGVEKARPALDLLAGVLEAGLLAGIGTKEFKFCVDAGPARGSGAQRGAQEQRGNARTERARGPRGTR